MSSRAVNTSNNIMTRIKEELLRMLSVISYSEKFETSDEEYKMSSQKNSNDEEIIKALEESNKKMSDYDGFVSGGRRIKKSSGPKTTKKENPIIYKSNTNEITKSDDERTL